MEEIILKYALQNAIKFGGKANPGKIIGKIMGEKPELRSQIKELQPKIMKIVQEVNAMSVDEQNAKLVEIAPELLEKKEVKERDIFAFLRINDGDKVITAFPPGPEKYPHIGHAKAILLNYMLAKKYNGQFVLRFEDTNPTLVKKEFYEIMQENFKWLGIKWDKLIYASDYMDLFYKHAEKLIEDGGAYMCFCNPEQIRESRMKSIPCECREKSVQQNLNDWRKFDVMKAGEAILRLKIDLEHKNSTMRDPTMFRIIEAEHARHKNKYRIWPNYDFQNSIMDGESGITHRLRSKEFEMRNELQRYIQKLLGYNITNIYEFARFNLEGVESSGRIIREKIENNELLGWDDPSLTTLVALRRRGFIPQAIENFVISTGITKSESTLTWDDLIVQNRRLLDKSANRYFFIENPVKIKIENAPQLVVEHKLHPEHPERGTRKLNSKEDFYVTKEDFDNFKDGKMYRLMDCLNFIKDEKLIYQSQDYSEFKKNGEKIMHYLPANGGLVDVEIMTPEKKTVKGFGEPLLIDLSVGDVVQFERFGFVRLDKIENNKLIFWLTHN
jgi:glutamyl-tRNA synthetase